MKKTLKNLLAPVLFLAVVLGIGFLPKEASLTAQAYVDNVSSSSISQTGQTKNTLTIRWSPSEDAVKYRLYILNSDDYDGDYAYVGETTSTNFTFKNLKSGTEYNTRIVSVDATGEESYPTTKYGNLFTLPGSVSGFKQERWYYFAKSIWLEWDIQTGVSGYEVSLYNAKGKKVKQKKTTSDWITFDISSNQVYTAKIRAYTTINGKTYYGSTAKTYCITQARVRSARLANKKLTIKWNKVPGATGYDIYVSTKKNSGYKKVKSVSAKTTSCTITKFNKKKLTKKRYYVYVETKKKVGKKTYKSNALYAWQSNISSNSYTYLD